MEAEIDAKLASSFAPLWRLLHDRWNMLFPRIYAAPTATQAEVVISFLKAQGFHPIDLQMSSIVFFAGADQSYHVQVPPEEVEAATEALKTNGYGDSITYQSDEPNAG
jgi:hypothetical protein